MKVIYDYQIFNMQEYGGISRYYYELANSFINNNTCDVKIIAPLFINKYISNLSEEVVVGRQLPQIKKTYRIRKYINILISNIILKKTNYDILHYTYYNPPKKIKPQAKTVISVYDMIHDKFGEYFPANNETSYIKAQAINRVDHIICISENTREDLIEITKVPRSKTSVVHLGFSFRESVQEGDRNIIDRPYLLFVGQRSPGYKNFHNLFQAYAVSKRLVNDFDLVCFGGAEFSSDELAEISRQGLSSEKVRHIGGSDKVLANLYSNAAALVYPSLYEGFGMPLLEAMSYKCPVVCSKASSLPEVAGNAAEYFDPYRVDNIGSAIEKVVYSSENSKSLIVRGLARIKHFSWDKCAQETYAIYSSIL